MSGIFCEDCGHGTVPEKSITLCKDCHEVVSITTERQNQIRDLVVKQTGAPADLIDGSGEDSGDPWDLTMGEIGQGFGYLHDLVFDLFGPDYKGTLDEKIKAIHTRYVARRFPVQRGPSIPWRMIAPHDRQCLQNHCDQSLEDIAKRGGLSPSEALAVLDDVKWMRSRWRETSETGCRDELERRRAIFEGENL